ncbi:SPFH domain-containing protein [Mycoplasmopsis pullorum]|uniref:Peptidase n=2 Tax=Mycoplasmopsis pullorum TaxID=48003 RepID=A0A1L4FSR3_9BACT|nr:SPFH domain-containing protein [Mycoplasmopsis pullorum]APJ38665.1 peptidase [Mycoplasmopsis pullorum]TNK82203.1 SPFH/Band 7/PHB domain protein [Mycoplasmopsis pullorum]TNK83171.1 SPFH/Band 7/PHB domain protein [Mycoplasmopsis pullorum]TNK84669.1 SPFH/Band 7/PHB domain protein [Mycoplasmopsis pullorum]TNK85456.1 SPFH/Band 7/PHB domain protein [Mycoplasmopsis pullorum]
MVTQYIIIGVSVFIGLKLIVLILWKTLKIVSERDFYVVERLGKYNRTLTRGIRFLIPFFEKIVVRDNIKEKVFDFPAQSVITKDNATIKVDTVVYLQITDPKLFAYGAEQPFRAIENLTSTTLRNLIGELELDESLTSREMINSKLTNILDNASDAWGIKVNRIEIQNITPPHEVQEAMIRQMQAERDKRAQILEAEGIRQSKILKAQGEKESKILNAEAEKREMILKAEADKEKSILEAQGKKQAIELLNSSNISNEVLNLKAIEQLGILANGNSTKIILPPNLSSIASTMVTAAEIFKEETKDK